MYRLVVVDICFHIIYICIIFFDFAGEGSGRLFVLYQQMVPEGEETITEPSGEKELAFSDGNVGLITDRCCYFVRNVPPSVQLDVNKVSDAEILFGEFGPSALGTIETILSQSF